MIQLNSSITEIKGIGEKNAALFQKLNIATVGDLLFHFPRDYEMLKPAVTIRQRKESAFQDAGVYGTVTSEPVLKYLRGKNSVSFEVKDEMGTAMTVTYFHMPYLKKSVKRGNTYVFFGQLFEKNNRCYRGKQKGGMKVPYNSRILGLVIGAERVKHGMTQEQLSGLAGITRGHLAVLESGQKSPKVETLWRIADALNLRLSDLIKLVEKEMEKGSGP